MAGKFLNDDFVLTTPLARTLYHEYAKKMPIFDYHCHLPPQDIAEDKSFDNLTRIWLAGDHYKWRAMRDNGVEERYCTGNASDEEKFSKWAETVPYTVGNPLYVWTHLELRRYFGIEENLSPKTAKKIYAECTAKLRTPQFTVRNLMRRSNVKAVCTTDDPADDLCHHQAIRQSGFEIKVLPTFRPDRAMLAADIKAYNAYIDRLGAAAKMDIRDYPTLLEALRLRHAFFHEMGCRLSDHGLEALPMGDASLAANAFAKARAGKELNAAELADLGTGLMLEFARLDSSRNWTQQLHLGALRNNNSRRFAESGPDVGYDSINDVQLAKGLSRFLDTLSGEGRLPKTILYTLNPIHNEVLATMTGNFHAGTAPGFIQFGSGWWFCDQRDGMEKQLTALSNMALLSRFVGMLTDSRSFLSYPRHEYFRRTLCRLMGDWAELGEMPDEVEWLGKLVEDISFNNARNYFGIEL